MGKAQSHVMTDSGKTQCHPQMFSLTSLCAVPGMKLKSKAINHFCLHYTLATGAGGAILHIYLISL